MTAVVAMVWVGEHGGAAHGHVRLPFLAVASLSSMLKKGSHNYLQKSFLSSAVCLFSDKFGEIFPCRFYSSIRSHVSSYSERCRSANRRLCSLEESVSMVAC
mmetsp:Transcript_2275/g.4938  ORF Transcript_2275/g.4938 Transcript_2275/m.4938 type:complete len:102 (-) Transcript_2275:529-834(-)